MFIQWGVDLQTALDTFEEHVPATVWLFVPFEYEGPVEWLEKTRRMSNREKKTESPYCFRSCLDNCVVQMSWFFMVMTLAAMARFFDGGIVCLPPRGADKLKVVDAAAFSLGCCRGIVDG